ncbi:alpha/beta hydrolase [Actinoallomurus iriomotensis]|uniref:alpha/beta hydrolase n=1 Tax=Actinoallomurus iriomotensis TaxID=478107 RepID=UPI0032DAC8F3
MLIQAGTGDHLLPQAEHLADRARQNGVEVTLELYPVATHGFHLFGSFLPEAQQAIEQAARFIAAATDDWNAVASG